MRGLPGLSGFMWVKVRVDWHANFKHLVDRGTNTDMSALKFLGSTWMHTGFAALLVGSKKKKINTVSRYIMRKEFL